MASSASLQASSTSSLSSTDASFLKGLSLAPAPPPRAVSPSSSPNHGLNVVCMAPRKKVNAYDANWNKTWFGAGIFQERTEVSEVNIIKRLEKKKLLSQVEKAGLLSKAESAGLTLSSIEKMGLLSKAEGLGLLSFAENFATASPSILASLSLPFLVAAIVTVVLIPDDNSALVLAQNAIAALFTLTAGGLFVSSIILNGLLED